MIEALASHAIVMVTRLVSRARLMGSKLTHIGHRSVEAVLAAMCLRESVDGINVLRHPSGDNPANAPQRDADRRAEVLAVGATCSGDQAAVTQGETSISRPLSERDHASITTRVRAATAALRAVLQEERAHVEAGEVGAILALRERKFEALAQWRALVEQLTQAQCTLDLGREAVEIEAYARQTFDLMAETLVARSQRRGQC